jgi:Ras-related GTP-binding protein A/B
LDNILPSNKELIIQIINKNLLEVAENSKMQIKKSNCKIYSTSIFYASLYKAWMDITSLLVKNQESINIYLKQIAIAFDANEIVVFDKITMLVIAYYTIDEHISDDERLDKIFNFLYRFEKLSIAIKNFKMSFRNIPNSFDSFMNKTKMFCSYLTPFTSNTLINIVSKKEIKLEFIKLNLNLIEENVDSLFLNI